MTTKTRRRYSVRNTAIKTFAATHTNSFKGAQKEAARLNHPIHNTTGGYYIVVANRTGVEMARNPETGRIEEAASFMGNFEDE